MNINSGKAIRLQVISKKYLLISITVILFFISGIYLYYYYNAQSARKSKMSDLRTMTFFKADQVSHWYEEKKANAIFYTTSPFSIDIYTKYTKEGSSIAFMQINQRNRLIKGLYGFENVFSIDIKKGEIIENDTDKVEIPSATINSFIDSAIIFKKIYVTNFYLNRLQQPQNAIIAPVINSQQEVLAVMVFYVNPNKYLHTVKGAMPWLYKTTQLSLVSPMGDSAIALRYPSGNLSAPVEFSYIRTDVAKSMLKETAVYEDRDASGKRMMVVAEPVPNLPWYILNRIERRELFAEVSFRTLFFAIILFMVVVGFLISMHFLFLEQKARQQLMLKTSELEKYFNNSSDMLCIADTDGFFRRLNPEWERVLGYSLSELEGHRFIENVHPDDVEKTIDVTKQLANNQEIQGFINRYRHKDGSYRWIEWRSYPVGPMIYASARDITERKQAELERQEHIDRAQAFSDATNEGIVISDNGVVVEANKQFLNMLGYTDLSEVVGKSILEEFTPPESQEAVKQHILTNSAEPYESNSYRKDKSIFPVETRGRSIVLKGKKMRITTIRDLTNQKRAEQEMRENDLWLRDSQHSSHIGSYNFSITTGKWKSSEELDVICGITNGYNKSIEGWVQLIHPDHQQEMADHLMKHVVEQHHPFNKEYRIIRQNDGEVRWVQGLGNLNFDNDGNPVQMIGTIQDITERKLAEQEVLKSEQRFKTIYNTTNEAIFIHDAENGKILDVNQRMLEMYGYTYEEALTLDVGLISSNESPYTQYDAEILIHRACIDGPQIIQWHSRHKNGRLFWTECSVKKVFYGEKDHVIVVVRDITERRQIEDALRLSEQKYRLLFENMTSGFALHQMIYDEQGRPVDYRYIEANPAFGKLTGVPTDILVGKTVREILPNTEEDWIQTFGNVALTGQPMYYMNYAKDFGKFFDTYVFSPEKDKFAVIFNEVTDRVMAENELKASEQKFADIFNLSPNVVGISRASDGKLVDANPAYTVLTGYSSDEYIGRTTLEMNLWIHPEEHGRMIKELDKKGEVLNFEMEMKAKDNSKHICLFSIKSIKYNNQECFIFIIHDITKLKEAENALRLSEQKFFNIYNLSPDMVGITRLSDGKILDGNPAMAKLTGFGYEEYIGKSTLEIGLWANPEDRNFALTTLKDKGEIKNFEIGMRIKDGTILTCLFSATTLTYNNEPCLLFVVNDITERKMAEDEIIKLNAELEKRVFDRTVQLEQANKYLESFAYSVSHDLRAPLRHVDGFVRLMYAKINQPSENITEYFEKINAASKRMSVMIDDLLTFSRLGRKELVMSSVNFTVLVNEIIEQLKPDISERQIKWNIYALPQLPGDKNLLKMVIENLISNAIKYTSKKEEAKIEIGSNQLPDNKVEIYVKDDGVGFNMAYVEKLFGVFQRLHSSEDFEGTGIGLANVKQIILRHKGSVRAEGKLNEGAIFYITLPK